MDLTMRVMERAKAYVEQMARWDGLTPERQETISARIDLQVAREMFQDALTELGPEFFAGQFAALISLDHRISAVETALRSLHGALTGLPDD